MRLTRDHAMLIFWWESNNLGWNLLVLTTNLMSKLFGVPALWQYRLWSFQTRGMKLERFLPKNQHTQRKSLNFENWISMGLRSFQKSEFQKSNISILPCTKLMNNEILVVFQCEKWFTYQTTWFKTHLLRFFNWKLSQIFDFINKKQ